MPSENLLTCTSVDSRNWKDVVEPAVFTEDGKHLIVTVDGVKYIVDGEPFDWGRSPITCGLFYQFRDGVLHICSNPDEAEPFYAEGVRQ